MLVLTNHYMLHSRVRGIMIQLQGTCRYWV
jgi:hypothetical protein